MHTMVRCLKPSMVSYLVLPLLLFTSALEASSMSIFDAGKVCVFSAISGTLLKDGKPVAGAKLVRSAEWQSKKQDETVTDEQGYFEFPHM